jgi:hypothetical protein
MGTALKPAKPPRVSETAIDGQNEPQRSQTTTAGEGAAGDERTSRFGGTCVATSVATLCRKVYAPNKKPHDLLVLREWAIQDSNLGPLPYQRSALTN